MPSLCLTNMRGSAPQRGPPGTGTISQQPAPRTETPMVALPISIEYATAACRFPACAAACAAAAWSST